MQTQLHFICLSGNYQQGVVRLNWVAKLQFVQVGEEHHLVIAKISKVNILKITDFVLINLFCEIHFCSSAT